MYISVHIIFCLCFHMLIEYRLTINLSSQRPNRIYRRLYVYMGHTQTYEISPKERERKTESPFDSARTAKASPCMYVWVRVRKIFKLKFNRFSTALSPPKHSCTQSDIYLPVLVPEKMNIRLLITPSKDIYVYLFSIVNNMWKKGFSSLRETTYTFRDGPRIYRFVSLVIRFRVGQIFEHTYSRGKLFPTTQFQMLSRVWGFRGTS
jgi:hypothetical protein